MNDYAGLREAVRRINEAADRGVRVEGIAREWLEEACTPEAIAALLAELDHLRARLEVTPQGPDGIDARDETIRVLEGERDKLRADAERYRHLRDCNSSSLMVMKSVGVDADDYIVLTGGHADAAIDAARGMGEAGK